MRPLPDRLLDGPFTVQQARAAGVGRDMLRGRRVRRLLDGVYVAADVPDSPELFRRAVRLVLPAEAAVSHESAAHLRRLPMPVGWSPGALHVSLPVPAGRPRVAGVTGHEVEWADGDVVLLGGERVTSVARTWCDVAASGWELVDLVAYADAVLRRDARQEGRRARATLAARVDAWGSGRGVRRLRSALALCRARVDSPMETRLRLLLRDAGLPEPVVNLPVRDEDGTPVHTPDLSWPQLRYAIDYDGAHHFRPDSGDWRRGHDIGRQEVLREMGWTLTVVTSHDLLQLPDLLLARVTRALRDRGAVM